MSDPDKSKVQGEGDYEAARRYRKEVTDFVKTHDVDKAARDAAPKSPEEAHEMDDAEAKGKSHAKKPGQGGGGAGKH